jgi:radical SAM superfamily enzyme YgiQ (UPF0313 family)
MLPLREDPPTVLLVNPWIYDFAAYDLWAKPLGLLYIGSVLRRNGYRIHLVDCLKDAPAPPNDPPDDRTPRRDPYGKGQFPKEHIQRPEILRDIPRRYSRYGISPEAFDDLLEKTPKPDAILIASAMTYWYPGVFTAIGQLRRRFPQAPVILGGIYATLCASHARANSEADYVVEGEGEVTTLRLLERTIGHRPVYVPSLDNLDTLPYPALDLLSKKDALCIATSRGCPYACPYCASSRLGGRLRYRDYRHVADEIQYWLETTEVTDFAFYDDALAYDSERHLLPLLREIVKRKVRCRFHTPNGVHVDEITGEVATLMFEAGFTTIRLGLEFANDMHHRTMGNKTSRQAFRRAVSWLHEAGFGSDDIGAYLLAGLPGQRAQDVEASIRFVADCGARPYLAEYSPIPGTRLWEDACSASPFDLKADPLTHNNSILPCRSESFTWEDLYRLKHIRNTAARREEEKVAKVT